MARYRGIVDDSARWDGFPTRPGDVFIGTTWMQMPDQRWRDLVDGDGVARCAARVRQLAPVDLVAWLHHADPLPEV